MFTFKRIKHESMLIHISFTFRFEQRTMCLLFAILVLTLTAVWVWLLRDKTFTYLAYAMFFPGAVAVGLSAYDGTLIQFVVTVLGLQKVGELSQLGNST